MIQEPIDPRVAEVDFGPLAGLLGKWAGTAGFDVSPEPDGTEENPYGETLSFEPLVEVENAESQILAAVRYHQVVWRLSNQEVFHDQVGYWMWDAEAGRVMQSLSIPRAVSLHAAGDFDPAAGGADATVLEVRATAGDEHWGILESPFMRAKARTLSYAHKLTLKGGKLAYEETTELEIYGRRFSHTDRSILRPIETT